MAKHEPKYNAAAASKWGLINWIFDNGKPPIIDFFFDASSNMVDLQVSAFFSSLHSKDNYYLRIQDDTLTGDASSVDISSTENLQKLAEIGTEFLKKPESKVNLETGKCESVEGGRTNEAALTGFAHRLSEERKLQQQQN